MNGACTASSFIAPSLCLCHFHWPQVLQVLPLPLTDHRFYKSCHFHWPQVLQVLHSPSFYFSGPTIFHFTQIDCMCYLCFSSNTQQYFIFFRSGNKRKQSHSKIWQTLTADSSRAYADILSSLVCNQLVKRLCFLSGPKHLTFAFSQKVFKWGLTIFAWL